MPIKSFKINAVGLRQIREGSKWSAKKLALDLRAKLGKPVNTTSEEKVHAAISTYQKIERTGRTSQKTAEALAEIFGVTLEAIKGDEPIDAFKRLQAMLG